MRFVRRSAHSQFLNDPALERQVIEGALASGDQKLIGIAHDWLRDTGQAAPAPAVSRATSAASQSPAEPVKPARYLRGVR